MDEQNVAEAEGETGQQSSGPAVAEGAHEHVNTKSCPPEVADAEELHPAVIKVGIEQEQKQIRGIKESGLNVGDERRAAVKVRIP